MIDVEEAIRLHKEGMNTDKLCRHFHCNFYKIVDEFKRVNYDYNKKNISL